MKKKSNMKTSGNKVVMSLLTVLVCTTNLFGQLEEISKIYDASASQTDETAFDADQVFRKVVVSLKLKDSKKAVKFRTAIAGHDRTAEVRLASLPEATWYSSISDRNKAMSAFLTKMKEDLHWLADQPNDQTQSNIYRSIEKVTRLFASDTGPKTLIIYSNDFLEVSSVYNMSQYRHVRNPETLISEFEAIKKEFERDVVLPDLSNVNVILVSRTRRDLHLFACRFFEKLLSSKGATVTTRATY